MTNTRTSHILSRLVRSPPTLHSRLYCSTNQYCTSAPSTRHRSQGAYDIVAISKYLYRSFPKARRHPNEERKADQMKMEEIAVHVIAKQMLGDKVILHEALCSSTTNRKVPRSRKPRRYTYIQACHYSTTVPSSHCISHDRSVVHENVQPPKCRRLRDAQVGGTTNSQHHHGGIPECVSLSNSRREPYIGRVSGHITVQYLRAISHDCNLQPLSALNAVADAGQVVHYKKARLEQNIRAASQLGAVFESVSNNR